MTNLKMFCLSPDPKHLDLIKKLKYTPVGLGKNSFDNNWFTDKNGKNISDKNEFYGEYTFHYWIWKNYISELKNNWIGFCQYRKFWSFNNSISEITDFNDLSNNLIKEIPESLNSYESIIGIPIYINQLRLSKFIKHNFLHMIKNPSLFFKKEKRNIMFHFDMMHGRGNLSKAIELLDEKEKKDFSLFVKNSVSFNPHNMFICRNSKILELYYSSVFPWLKKCEKVFGFELYGYGSKRMYGFLAERYMSYWFQKYTKFKLMPIIFKDLTDFQKIKGL